MISLNSRIRIGSKVVQTPKDGERVRYLYHSTRKLHQRPCMLANPCNFWILAQSEIGGVGGPT